MSHLFLAILLAASPDLAPLPSGPGERTIDVGGRPLTLHAYKSANATADGPLVIVLHGTLRNAKDYRDWGEPIADRCGGLVVTPEFDSERFPSSAYQFGGLLTRSGELRPREEWTWSVIPAVVAAVRRAEKRPVMPYYLIGHSAGGQFLVRLAAFAPGEAARIVAANSGSLLAPTRDQPYGYGFGRLAAEAASDATIRRYLAAPLTLYQGTGDTATTREQDQYLDTGAEAKKQGASRLERGRNTFRRAKDLAEQRGWEFRWRLVEAEGIAHVAAEMFKNAKCDEALFGKKE